MALLLPFAANAGPLVYRLTDLGALGGSTSSSASRGLNDHGDVVGSSQGRAFLWRRGTLFDLGHAQVNPDDYGGSTDTDSLAPTSKAHAVNNAGQVVGSTWIISEDWEFLIPIPFVWTAGTMSVLGTRSADAFAINESGVVVGRTGPDYEFDFYAQAIVWNGVQETTQPRRSLAYAINDNGQVAGNRKPSDDWELELEEPPSMPVIWVGDAFRTLPGGEGEAFDIRNDGTAVGVLYEKGAVLWRGDGYELLSEDADCAAVAINAQGLVVGNCRSGPLVCSIQEWETCGDSPFIWREGMGFQQLQDLLLEGTSADLVSVADINRHGEIAATAYVAGVRHAVLLTPVLVDAPPTLALLLVLPLFMTLNLRRAESARHLVHPPA